MKYTITMTYDKQKDLTKAFIDYRDAMTQIDNEEHELITPIQEQMDERRKQAWTDFTKAKRKILA